MKKSFKDFLQKSFNLMGYKISRLSGQKAVYDPVIDNDEKFVRIYNKCKGYSMTTCYCMYALYKSVEYIIKNNIAGDFVECGVWKGGSTMFIAYCLIELNATDRKIYLYDTFKGMAKPTEEDYAISNNKLAINKWEDQNKKDYNNWAYASLSEVQSNMYTTGYHKENIVFIEGKVEDTIPEIVPDNIAILRLDTDWYDSTMYELIHLYPLLCTNGVLIIDDYGFFAGSKKAVDKYFFNNPILLNRIDNSGRIGIKIK